MSYPPTPKIRNEKIYLSEHPKALRLWHAEKNIGLNPQNISVRSHQIVWWKCSKGDDHEWKASIARITQSLEKHNHTCPICSGSKVVLSNCLATTRPQISQFWHPTKNGSLTPYSVTGGSNFKVWWFCPEGDDHVWETSVNNRMKQGCPFCSGRRISKTNNLEAKFPEIAKEWHPTKNGTLLPTQFTANSNKKVVWLCPKGHDYSAKICHRTGEKSGCPFCSGHKLTKENSLAHKRPDLAKEWHPTKNGNLKPSEIHTSSSVEIWWCCSKDSTHVWKSTVDNRNKGNDCPTCNRGWTLERIRLFVLSILPLIGSLNEAELYTLSLRSGALDASRSAKGRPFINALSTGKFPKEELEKFTKNEPSLVDDFINNPPASLEILEEDLTDKKNCLSEDEIKEEEDNNRDLPVIQTKEILTSLENKIFATFDEETVDFFLKSAVSKIWQHVFIDNDTALSQLGSYNGNGLYSVQVKTLFLAEYEGATSLKIPDGYSFSIGGVIQLPNLMQLYTAYLVKSRKRIGNWSGTGSGKTLAAVLASRIIKAKCTLICCPNNVVENWKRNILEIFPDSAVQVKDIDLKSNFLQDQPNYFILHYEFFQKAQSRSQLEKFLIDKGIDFVIIDEIHYSKQRYAKNASLRKQVISSFLLDASSLNNNLHVLGMSATPVINNLYEGKTLVELVTGSNCTQLQTHPTAANCMSMHHKFISHGIRLMPKYSCGITTTIKNLDCSEYLHEIRQRMSKKSMDYLDGILTKVKIPYILEEIRPKTIIYSQFWKKNGALMLLKETIQDSGWKVSVFTGDTKDGFDEFVDGDADVLIASSCIGTGVDRLQHVCNRLIISSLPWTHAELEQLKGRIYRQGQKRAHVDIIVPLTFAEINGKRWSWCESRWERIQFKRAIADAAVDGVMPQGHLRSPEQAFRDTMKWLDICLSPG